MRQKTFSRLLYLLALGVLLAGCAAGPIRGPAARYLPAPVDLPAYLSAHDNLGLERIVEQTPARALPEDSAYVNFDNNGFSFTTQPQNGVYLRLAYWVVVLRSDRQAQTFYQHSSQESEVINRLAVIMPSTIQQSLEKVDPLSMAVGACQEAALYRVRSKVIYTPDLYLLAVCRVENAVVQVWAYTPDNYDGNNAPIPDDVISAQMSQWVEVATARLTR